MLIPTGQAKLLKNRHGQVEMVSCSLKSTKNYKSISHLFLQETQVGTFFLVSSSPCSGIFLLQHIIIFSLYIQNEKKKGKVFDWL